MQNQKPGQEKMSFKAVSRQKVHPSGLLPAPINVFQDYIGQKGTSNSVSLSPPPDFSNETRGARDTVNLVSRLHSDFSPVRQKFKE